MQSCVIRKVKQVMEMMKKPLRNSFSFTSRERNGILVLLAILFATTTIKMCMLFHKPMEENFDNRDVLSELTFFESQITIQNDVQDVSSGFRADDLYETPELFYFDPNIATEAELIRLGMNEKLVRTLLNYRQKGGRFRIQNDLKKIYGMTSAEYARLEPYIRIVKSHTTEEGEAIVFRSPAKIELNMADTNDLMALKGIGTVLANRIVKYRALLGGYYHSGQLIEVYGISDSLVMTLEQVVYADASKIERINVNIATQQQLSRHPYIGGYYAEGIIQYRQHAKKISGIEELLRNNLLPEDKRETVINYLTF